MSAVLISRAGFWPRLPLPLFIERVSAGFPSPAQDCIEQALDLADADAKQLRQRFSVVLERTIRELTGEPCLTLEVTPPTKQQIVCSR